MFGPSKQEYEAALQKIAVLERDLEDLKERKESATNWTHRCEEENRQKDAQLTQEREKSIRLAIELKHSQQELEALRGNLARITPGQTPFLTFGCWRIRIGRIEEIKADEEGYVEAINKTPLMQMSPSWDTQTRIKVDDLERLIAVHHHRDEN
jgi:chromosome segregation ATPase